MRGEAQGSATGYRQPPLCYRGSWLVDIVNENRAATSFLARFLDTLVTGVQRPLALGLFHQLLLRLSFCRPRTPLVMVDLGDAQKWYSYRLSASP